MVLVARVALVVLAVALAVPEAVALVVLAAVPVVPERGAPAVRAEVAAVAAAVAAATRRSTASTDSLRPSREYIGDAISRRSRRQILLSALDFSEGIPRKPAKYAGAWRKTALKQLSGRGKAL